MRYVPRPAIDRSRGETARARASGVSVRWRERGCSTPSTLPLAVLFTPLPGATMPPAGGPRDGPSRFCRWPRDRSHYAARRPRATALEGLSGGISRFRWGSRWRERGAKSDLTRTIERSRSRLRRRGAPPHTLGYESPRLHRIGCDAPRHGGVWVRHPCAYRR